MATFDRTDDLRGAQFTRADLQGARFTGADLRGARFEGCDVSEIVMRGVEVQKLEIDSPWIFEGETFLLVNGVDVLPLVDAELNRRFPGRALRQAPDPDGLREAWATVELAWAGTLERAAAMPAGTVDVSIAGEWSFAETLRHLVMATDTWLRKAILGVEQPYHPLGKANAGADRDGLDLSVFVTSTPSYDEVLEVRAERQAMVRAFVATLTAQELAAERRNPWAPQHRETTLSCLHTILDEEWEHHRYAVRDLDAIDAGVR